MSTIATPPSPRLATRIGAPLCASATGPDFTDPATASAAAEVCERCPSRYATPCLSDAVAQDAAARAACRPSRAPYGVRAGIWFAPGQFPARVPVRSAAQRTADAVVDDAVDADVA